MTSHLLHTTTIACIALLSSCAQAGVYARIVEPGSHDHHISLPKFGMHSYNNGWGERVTRVRYGGIAFQLGIQPGDTILKLNHNRLCYHGSWENALSDAMTHHNGHIELLIRDRNTGRIVYRHIDLDPHHCGVTPPVYGGPVGPITPKSMPYQAGKPVLPPAPVTPRQVIRYELRKLFE